MRVFSWSHAEGPAGAEPSESSIGRMRQSSSGGLPPWQVQFTEE